MWKSLVPTEQIKHSINTLRYIRCRAQSLNSVNLLKQYVNFPFIRITFIERQSLRLVRILNRLIFAFK